MYSLIIVDDEEIIRKGLSAIVDWESLGFRISAALPNGEAALAFVSENQVDAVLADIIMPRRSGLELAAELRRVRPDIRVVILSGYDKSKYARQAIDCSVFGYLLKPSKEADIRDVMTRLKAALDEDRRRESILMMHGEASRARELERLCLDTREAAGPSILPEALKTEWLGIVLVEAGAGRSELGAAAASRFQDRVLVFPVGSRCICTLCHSPDEGACAELLHECRAFLEEANAQSPLSGGVGRPVPGIARLAEAYASAAANLERRLYLGPGTIAGDEGAPDPVRPGIEKEAAVQTADFLRKGDGEGASRSVRRLFEALRSARVSDRLIAKECFLGFLYRLREELAGYGNDLDDQDLSVGALAGIVDRAESLDEMGILIGESLARTAGRLAERATDPTRKLVLRARGLIDARFGENLSLASIAGELAISTSYLSRLFKQELGYNFKDYLTEVRIAEAKRLLANLGYKVYEIAERVGFSDQSYFSEIFKQRTGMSPLEYRERPR